jgi:signal transduction histidine kinase
VAGTGRNLEQELGEALEREKQARSASAEVTRRASFLSEASRLLGDSLDVAVLDRVAHLCVPAWADWCSFHLLDVKRQLRLVTVVAKDPQQEAWARSFLEKRYPLADPSGIASVIDGARSVALARAPDVFLQSVVPPENQEELARRLSIHSLLCAPLAARGCCFGALLLAQCDSTRGFSAEDQSLAEELALRSAVAVDNGTLYQQANEALRAREELIAVASHELRTPLTAVMLMVDKLLRTLSRREAISPEELVKMGEAMRGSLRRLAGLVESLLDSRDIGDLRSSLVLENMDIAAVVREVAERFETPAERARCALEVRGADKAVLGRWDRLRIDQILTNLVANALKYGRGKPVEISLESDAHSVTMTVRDHGIGIADHDVERIFERFERAAPVTNYGGFALGLYITRQLVEAHGGRVRVTSAIGQGSTFVVALPRTSTR